MRVPSFLGSIGLKNVTADIQAIGLANSTFMKRVDRIRRPMT